MPEILDGGNSGYPVPCLDVLTRDSVAMLYL